MRILLVGNYKLDNQSSMLRYAEMLREKLSLRGHYVEIIQPEPRFGHLVSHEFIRKWLGYIDKYLLFPRRLRTRSAAFDVIHVCDHSNSMYLRHTGGPPASITCHDLLAIDSARGRYPEQSISFTGKVLQQWILKSLLRARNIVCVSDNTAEELQALTQGAKPNVSVIPNPLVFHDSPAPAEDVVRLRGRLGLADEDFYLLHVGGNQWYKNRIGVLRIFRLLLDLHRSTGAPEPRLIMAGKEWTHPMREFVRENRLERHVVEATTPSDEELRALYSGATALLFPSLYEGFGWPLIEAQSCGCPVITSNRPPMTEVAGSSALYIDPADERAAAALIAEALDRLYLRRESGFRNVERFSMDRILPVYESFFKAVVEGSVPQRQALIPENEVVSKDRKLHDS